MNEVSIKEHLETLLTEMDRRNGQRFDAQEQAVSAALAASRLAVDKAEAQAEKWRDNANEWRGAMSDRERDLVSRVEADARFETMTQALATANSQLAKVEQRIDAGEARGRGLNAAWGYLIGAAGFATAIYAATRG